MAATWQSINGEAPRDRFGASVAISSDGTRLAVGAPQNDAKGTDTGLVRVFSLDTELK